MIGRPSDSNIVDFHHGDRDPFGPAAQYVHVNDVFAT